MKKIRNKERYQQHQIRRSRKTLKQRKRNYLNRRSRNLSFDKISSHNRSVQPGYYRVAAPLNLSMVGNPEESIELFSKLAQYYERRRPTFLSLSNVSRIDYDAIVVLLSIMIRFKTAGIGFDGNFPSDQKARLVLLKSKFFEVLYAKYFAEQDSYTVGHEHKIHTHADRRVDSLRSSEIVKQASSTVWGGKNRSQGVQRILLELMQNTNNHASLSGQGEKHWWLSVNHDPNKKTASFSFVDFGVGIFHSLDNKPKDSKWFDWRNKLLSLFSSKNNAEILKMILAGDLHKTVTRQAFRGKGLPGIDEVLRRNWISNLVIITNDVYANVSQNDFRTLKNPFNGTLVSWDLTASNHSTLP